MIIVIFQNIVQKNYPKFIITFRAIVYVLFIIFLLFLDNKSVMVGAQKFKSSSILIIQIILSP